MRRASIALVLAAASPAQVTADLHTATEVGVFAGSGALGGSVVQSIPASTRVAQTRTLSAATASFGGPGSASATLEIAGPAALVLTERGDSSTSMFAFPGAPAGTATGTPGAHDLLWTLRGTGSGTVAVVVDTAHTQAAIAPPMVRVDVGDDGSWDLVVAAGTGARVDVPLRVAGAVPFRIRAHALAATTAQPNRTESYALRAELRWEYRATPARIVPYGQGCGPVLVAADRPRGALHAIDAAVTAAIPSAPVALLFGTRRRADPIGASGCTLYTLPVAYALLAADATGRASWRLDVPAPVQATLQMQAVPFAVGGAFAASGGVELVFAD